MVVGRDGGGSELWSEGRGMLEAESMSFYATHYSWLCECDGI